MTIRQMKHGLRGLWQYVRQVTGDDAYERYVLHQHIAHACEAPMTRSAFFRKRQDEKWSKVSRCC